MPNNTFRESEDKLFDEMFPYFPHSTRNVFNEVHKDEIKSFLHDSQRRLVEYLVGEIMKKTLDSWHEAQTLKLNIDGSATPDVNLKKMGSILSKKLEVFINQTLK